MQSQTDEALLAEMPRGIFDNYEKESKMLLIITTQHYENYGAHDWDGQGECPQRWKAKGGNHIKVSDVPPSISLETLRRIAIDAVSEFNDYFEVTVLGVHFESDDWMSDFEKSQLEWEGSITYPEPKFTHQELYIKAGKSIAERKEMMA